MKPYFAKYIPIEGEIEEGDKVLLPTGSIVTAVRKNNKIGWFSLRNNTEGHVYFYPESQRVKFFICSRNFQSENEVMNNQFTKIFWSDEMEYLYQKGLLLKEGLFKVIGEISPNAKWVKPDDQFDESDWILYNNIEMTTDKSYGDFNNLDNYCIQIKCPCCETFK